MRGGALPNYEDGRGERRKAMVLSDETEPFFFLLVGNFLKIVLYFFPALFRYN